jgi:photosystem II stability/assembly factor-like uncharacterized protein
MKASEIVKELILVLLILIVAGESFAQSGWHSQQIGTRNYVHVKFLDSNTGYMIGSDGTILKSTNGGFSWFVQSTSLFVLPVKSGFVYNNQIFGIISGGTASGRVYITTNAGNSWKAGDDILPIGGVGSIWLRGVFIVNQLTAFTFGTDYGPNTAPYVDGIVYKTTNAGLNWFQSFRGDFEHYDLKAKDSLNIAKSSGAFMRSSDGGVSWNYVSNMHAFGGIMSDPFRDTIMVSDTRGLVIRSTNRGNEFIELQTGNTKPLRNLFFVDRKRGHFIGDSGVILFTSNAGETFSVQQSNTMQKLNSVYFINKDTGFAVGDSGVVLRTYTGGILTGVESNNAVTNPTEFALLQNFPNPFNPTTTIRFDVRTSGNVSLKVFDVLGREVEVMVNEYLKSGSYSVQFSGDNLPSGVYYYELRAESFSETKRMVLAK